MAAEPGYPHYFVRHYFSRPGTSGHMLPTALNLNLSGVLSRIHPKIGANAVWKLARMSINLELHACTAVSNSPMERLSASMHWALSF